MRHGDDAYDLDALRAIVAADAGSPEFPALAEAERRTGDPGRARSIAETGLAAAPGRLAGRVALGLALLDQGRIADARTTLSVILDPVLEPHRVAARSVAGVDDDELDLAFAVAEPQIDEMISPNRMAEQVLLDHTPPGDELEFAAEDELDVADDDELDAGADGDDSPALELDEEEDGIGTPGRAFQTATMADLLAKQGDVAGAEAIRRELGRRAGPSSPARPVDAATVPAVSPFSIDLDLREGDESGTGAGRPLGDRDAGRTLHILATLERWLQNIQRGR